MLGSVVGCVQGVGVRVLAMSDISEFCVLDRFTRCVQGVGVRVLAMSGTSEHWKLGSIAGCAQGVWDLVPQGHSFVCEILRWCRVRGWKMVVCCCFCRWTVLSLPRHSFLLSAVC